MPRLLPWQWFRRTRSQPPAADEPKTQAVAVRAEPRDERLRFARDYLLASGARVRIEGDDEVAGTLPNGSEVRYTTAAARARADEGLTFLAEGSTALATMLDECATHARMVALTLAPAGEAEALALTAVAGPEATCGACMGWGSEPHLPGVPSCARCPLRDGRLLFAGLEGARSTAVLRHSEAHEVELTYLVAARDRNGRRDLWERVALGEHGTRRTPLSAAAIARAQPGVLRAEDAARLENVMRAAQDLLAPALSATASFLRQRTEREYAGRIVEAEATHRRAQREQPERAAEIDAALARECEALAEVFAVEVEARLEAVCLIATSLAEVRVSAPGGTMTLTVDLGRGEVLPPRCARCDEACCAGSVCTQGHVLCTSCTAPRVGSGAPACVVCGDKPAGEPAPGGLRPQRPPARAAQARALTGVPVSDPGGEHALTVEGLEQLPPRIWRECAAWLLESAGYALDDPPAGEDVLRWRERKDGEAITACALRLPAGWPLGADDVRVAMDPRPIPPTPFPYGGKGKMEPAPPPLRGEAEGPPPGAGGEVLLTTASATEAAAREAAQLGVRLLAREELTALLARLAGAHQRERAEAHAEARERASAAVTARKTLLAALKAHEAALARPGRAKPATARSAVANAVSEIDTARQAAARALLAWETLVGDWEASFGERPERDGSLRIGREPQGFAELADRATHLREAMGQAIASVQRTPAEGELGYGEWRRAVIEELARRCEALRLRVQAIDPARWQDDTQARDLEAEAAATRAHTAAERAAARADQLYAQLAPRAGMAR